MNLKTDAALDLLFDMFGGMSAFQKCCPDCKVPQRFAMSAQTKTFRFREQLDEVAAGLDKNQML